MTADDTRDRPGRRPATPVIFLALNWKVWAVLAVLFLLALGRRLWRQWRANRRRRW